MELSPEVQNKFSRDTYKFVKLSQPRGNMHHADNDPDYKLQKTTYLQKYIHWYK